MTYVPGTHAARLLFGYGLRFDAVVEGLVIEIGMDVDEASRATLAAAFELGRAVPQFV